MLFNSWQFFIFFPIVTILYFVLNHKYRWFLLLISSCFFYMAFIPIYILILAATIIIDYFAAIFIFKSQGKLKDFYLYISIISTCLILFFFKYFNFFNNNIIELARIFHWNYSVSALKLILPIGLSFHTFQSLSYVIEVYRGNQKPEKHFGIYALYVMFYPQLVAGPIERPQNLLHQFHEEHKFDYTKVTSGLKQMAWGLFKKVVIADNLSLFVSPIYDHPQNYSGGLHLIATLFFTFQVYCDFSGYSDIAIGTARVMGFDLMQNFNRPYAAKTLSDFWKRWHISLSTWLRDYVYDPLAIATRHWGTLGIICSLITTFFISGLWHGASWNFVIWGLLHGFALSFEAITTKSRKKISKLLPSFVFNLISLISIFSFVSFTYIFFRAKNLNDSIYIVSHIFNFKSLIDILHLAKTIEIKEIHGAFIAGYNDRQFVVSICFVILLELIQFIQIQKNNLILKIQSNLFYRWFCYYALAFSIILCGAWFTQRDFIYFQF